MVMTDTEVLERYSRIGSTLSLIDKMYLELGGTFSELLRGEDDSSETPSHFGQLSLFEASAA